jgi:hypothetical protein
MTASSSAAPVVDPYQYTLSTLRSLSSLNFSLSSLLLISTLSLPFLFSLPLP